MLRSKPQRWIPELRFGYPPLRNFPKSFWEKLGFFLESLGGSQRQLCIKTRPLSVLRAHPHITSWQRRSQTVDAACAISGAAEHNRKTCTKFLTTLLERHNRLNSGQQGRAAMACKGQFSGSKPESSKQEQVAL